jgi:hypothetical protein
MLPTACRTGSRLFGIGDDVLLEADMFDLPPGQTAVWGFQSGLGNVDRLRTGTPLAFFSWALAEPRRQPRVLFSMLLGSWFGDWAAGENNLLRAVIASKDYGLASFFVRNTEWRFEPLAWGDTLGDAQLLTANEGLRYSDVNRGTTRTLTILGDPTLRLHVTAPPRDLRGDRTRPAVRLRWQTSPDAQAGYLVYRSGAAEAGPFQRVTPNPIRETQFEDPEAPPGARYLVRAAQLIPTASGSYTNLSQGVFWPEARQ